MDVRSEDFGELQRLVDFVFPPGISAAATVSRLDVEMRAEVLDLAGDLLEVVAALPPRTYTRQRLCDQLNSCLVARGWGTFYGTVE